MEYRKNPLSLYGLNLLITVRYAHSFVITNLKYAKMNLEMTPVDGPVIKPKKKPAYYDEAAFKKSLEDMYDEMGFPVDENFDGFLFI
ncbi:MAG: hypothetical protein Aureis2KO_16330 [Aureisphaera sp.]